MIVYLYDADHPTVTPNVRVEDLNGNTLTEGTDYTLSIANNTGSSNETVTATVTITGMGDYIGTATTTFRIANQNIENCEIKGSLEIYEGYQGVYNSLEENVEVWIGETQLEVGNDYNIDVEYVDPYVVGQTYTATITGDGNWGGETTVKVTMIELYHTVVFDNNGGEGTIANDTVQRGQHYILPDCPFTPPYGYEFDRWDVSCGEDNYAVEYYEDNYLFTAPYIFNESDVKTITVTAHWKEKAKYSVTLPDNMVIVSGIVDNEGKAYKDEVITFKAVDGYSVFGDVKLGDDTLTPYANGIYTVTVADSDINVSAIVLENDTCYFDESTSTLHLRGNVDKADVQQYNGTALSVVAEPGTVLPADSSSLFSNFSKATNINLANADTSNVTDMSMMFSFCNALTSLNLCSFDTSSVTDMGYMFYDCSALTSLDLSHFDTSSVTIMTGMFSYCQALTTLDLSNFDTSSVTTMNNMFNSCQSLTAVNLRSFDTSSVTAMRFMFAYCNALTSLDLSSFDTSSVTNMYGMFQMDSPENSLTTIYVSENWNTDNVTNSTNTFQYCKKLVGENGTACNGTNNTDKSYAHIDGGTANPGYLTGKYSNLTVNAAEHGTLSADKTGSVLVGETVTLTVTPNEHYQVKSVTVNGGAVAVTDNGNGTYSFTMPAGDVTVSAEFEMIKTEVVINSVDINGIATPTTVYAETYTSTAYTVPASPYLDGYTFSGWTVNDTLYTTADTVQTAVENLVKAGTAVTVEVVYTKKEDTHTVSVNAPETVGCTIKNENGDVITAGTSVNVSEQLYAYADQNAPGQHFAYCLRIQGDKQTIVGYETTYAFHMPDEDMVLSAVYVDNDVEVEKVGTAFIESVTTINGSKIAFVSKLSVPEGARMLRAGIVANTEANLNGSELTTATAQFTRYDDSKCYKYLAYKYTWTKGNVNANDVWCVRSYLVYSDEKGEHTVYGELVRANLNGIITEQ